MLEHKRGGCGLVESGCGTEMKTLGWSHRSSPPRNWRRTFSL